MEILAVKDEFKCAALNSQELSAFFMAKWLLYSDENPDVAEMKDEILDNMRQEGRRYYSAMFNMPEQQAFVLLTPDNRIIGSAETFIVSKERQDVEFQSSHILSAWRGQGLSALLYKGREKYCRDQRLKNVFVEIKPENSFSQKAALKNGFKQTGETKDGNFVFQKILNPA